MTSGIDVLHDVDLLRERDRAGLLPAAATIGAQVRSLAGQLESLPAPDRPRAFVIVGSQVADEVAMVSALAGPGSPCPVVGVPDIPSWVGALDVVVVLADRRADPVATRAAQIAGRRGATVILRADESVGAPGPGVSLVPPQLAVPEALAAVTRLALACAVARWCGVIPAGGDGPAEWADELDAVALSCHPSVESFVNPAVSLAEHLAHGHPLLVGGDPVGDALTGVAARLLFELSAEPAAILRHRAAELSPAVLRAAAAPRDIFADDDPAGDAVLTVLLGTPLPDDGRHPVADSLPGALVVAPETPTARPGDRSPGGRPTGERDDDPVGRSGPGPDLRRPPLAVVVRWTFAAIYLGLTRPQQPIPIDHPDGLGRSGTALGAVRSDELRADHGRGRDLGTGFESDDDLDVRIAFDL
ncbi:hypothetical protein ABLG96_15190 [Nakamurella sp. A5-74]|uniref:TobH protein n=1 Tax=Nakamurella sp. A5-74 TaxID=3158264 RepID=A0AAU8DNW2_9ACTN